ncbi:MAG: efflux RND transporter permease subunit, partial [Polyangiaceae bacterium]|nr:efflux RND transporter permease subunit [Polyangiaceae bacterium]
EADGPASIVRENNTRMLALKFNIEGRDMGSVVADAKAAVDKEVEVPDGSYFVWGGEFENQERAMARLAIIVPLSILVIFLLVYMALGCATSTLVVLAMIPFGAVGGLFALELTGIPLSVSAAVGFITLIGQATLDSLLLTTAVNARRLAGEDMMTALFAGTSARFRPVMMTGLLAMIGLAPMALSTSAGSEIQRPFAVVVIGGLATAVTATVFVLPVIYSFLVKKDIRPADDPAEGLNYAT